jgi:hypothetical protein
MEDSIEDFQVQMVADNKDSVQLHKNMIHNLENRMRTLEEKELKQWEKYSEDGMPKSIFEKLNAAVLKEKEEVRQSLLKARESMPTQTDYANKISMFSDALDALKSPEVSDELKNKYLKSIFEKIVYYREKPVRVTRNKCIELNMDPHMPSGASWYSPPFELDVTFKN